MSGNSGFFIVAAVFLAAFLSSAVLFFLLKFIFAPGEKTGSCVSGGRFSACDDDVGAAFRFLCLAVSAGAAALVFAVYYAGVFSSGASALFVFLLLFLTAGMLRGGKEI